MFFALNAYTNWLAISGIFLLILTLIAATIALTIFWTLMIVDCVKRKNLSDNQRIAWILVLIFLQFVGASIYYYAVKKEKKWDT